MDHDINYKFGEIKDHVKIYFKKYNANIEDFGYE